MTGTTVEVYPEAPPWDTASRDAARCAQSRRRWRWDLLQFQWQHSGLERVRACRRFAQGQLVGLKVGPEGSYWDGLQTCSSVWACPVCSAIIRQRRAERIEAGAVAWTAVDGRWLAFLTLTVQHRQFDSLEALYGGLRAAWKSLREQRWWRSLGWDGFWRSVEVTYGVNGWHPHLHLLLFGHGPADLARIGRDLAPRWRDAVVKAGLRPTSLARGSRLQAVSMGGESLAQYLSKVLDGEGQPWSPAMELARSDMKRGGKGRSPFEILEAAADGEAFARARWHEYEQATFGKRAIESSRGLCELVGMEDQADEELVAEDVGGEAVLLLHRSEYRAIAEAGYAAAVLDVAERGDGLATVDFVRALLRIVAPS